MSHHVAAVLDRAREISGTGHGIVVATPDVQAIPSGEYLVISVAVEFAIQRVGESGDSAGTLRRCYGSRLCSGNVASCERFRHHVAHRISADLAAFGSRGFAVETENGEAFTAAHVTSLMQL